MTPRIYVCTTNPGKLADFALGLAGISLAPLPGLRQIQPPEENGETFEENAASKALYYSRYSEQSVLADDSGIVVKSLDGAPGVYSARYSGEGATDGSNNALLLTNLAGREDRSAGYVCVLSVAQSGRLLHTVEGSVGGWIVDSPRGTGGFGYDPLFFFAPLNRTFAELTPEERLSVSHRGNALRQLARLLKNE
ncbi:MAG TPA: RdgB/HAM1 family non-canonical purine NTP pyrophosphatase [Bryobacteraceae bacterium]|nr:RdgB/HAM1 family non-canonical purine NTP pyrophosphatase [Bryobacteraceae bacterium]